MRFDECWNESVIDGASRGKQKYVESLSNFPSKFPPPRIVHPSPRLLFAITFYIYFVIFLLLASFLPKLYFDENFSTKLPACWG